MGEVGRFSFKKDVSAELIENRLMLAILAAEGIHGEEKVSVKDIGYIEAGNRAVVDVSCEVGEHVAQIFMRFMTKEIGRKRFIYERVPKEERRAG